MGVGGQSPTHADGAPICAHRDPVVRCRLNGAVWFRYRRNSRDELCVRSCGPQRRRITQVLLLCWARLGSVASAREKLVPAQMTGDRRPMNGGGLPRLRFWRDKRADSVDDGTPADAARKTMSI